MNQREFIIYGLLAMLGFILGLLGYPVDSKPDCGPFVVTADMKVGDHFVCISNKYTWSVK